MSDRENPIDEIAFILGVIFLVFLAAWTIFWIVDVIFSFGFLIVLAAVAIVYYFYRLNKS